MTQSTQKPRRVTLHDIAAAAGCSHTAVSLALRGSDLITGARRRTIMAAAKRLNYRPDLAARQLRRGRSGTVGIFSYHLEDTAPMRLVPQLMQQLYAQNYRPVLGLGALDQRPWDESPWISTFLDLRVEAMIVFCEGPQSVRLPKWSAQLPIIFISAHIPRELRCDAVALDMPEAGRMAAEHLLERGRRDIALVCPDWHPLREGYAAALTAAGRALRHISRATLTVDKSIGADIARQMLEAGSLPDGVIHLNTRIACHFIKTLDEAGVRIPQDMAVIGYDVVDAPELMKIAPTTIEQPIAAMAAAAAELVHRRLEDPGQPPMHRRLPHQLVVRQST